MKLLLVEGYSKPEKSKLDNIFILKDEMYHYCLWYIARFKARNDEELVMLLERAPHSWMLSSLIRRHYSDLQTTITFDKMFTEALWDAAEGQREEYRKLQISEQFLRKLNQSPIRPKFLSPPLIYTDDGIGTLYSGKFWGRIDVDLYGHRGLVIKSGDRGRYFASFEVFRKSSLYTQPFLVRQDLENEFIACGVPFSQAFNILKGLFSGWYDVFR